MLLQYSCNCYAFNTNTACEVVPLLCFLSLEIEPSPYINAITCFAYWVCQVLKMIGEIALWLFLYTQRKVRDQLGYYEEIDCTGGGGGWYLIWLGEAVLLAILTFVAAEAARFDEVFIICRI